MRVVLVLTCVIFAVVVKSVVSLPCLSDESKAKFAATRKALGDLKTHIDNKIKKLDNDMASLTIDFQKRQWKKYKGHCYYFGGEKLTWFLAERRCKSIGGYLVKIDDEAENKWVFDNRPKKSYFWNGLTDLKEGEFRWSYDQSLAKYKPWYSGYGNKGTSNNCGILYGSTYTWLDFPCLYTYYYVCESHFCF